MTTFQFEQKVVLGTRDVLKMFEFIVYFLKQILWFQWILNNKRQCWCNWTIYTVHKMCERKKYEIVWSKIICCFCEISLSFSMILICVSFLVTMSKKEMNIFAPSRNRVNVTTLYRAQLENNWKIIHSEMAITSVDAETIACIVGNNLMLEQEES